MSLCDNIYGVPVCGQTQQIPGPKCATAGEGRHELHTLVPVPLAAFWAYVA